MNSFIDSHIEWKKSVVLQSFYTKSKWMKEDEPAGATVNLEFSTTKIIVSVLS